MTSATEDARYLTKGQLGHIPCLPQKNSADDQQC